jgi:hypothetical protein
MTDTRDFWRKVGADAEREACAVLVAALGCRCGGGEWNFQSHRDSCPLSIASAIRARGIFAPPTNF